MRLYLICRHDISFQSLVLMVAVISEFKLGGAPINYGVTVHYMSREFMPTSRSSAIVWNNRGWIALLQLQSAIMPVSFDDCITRSFDISEHCAGFAPCIFSETVLHRRRSLADTRALIAFVCRRYVYGISACPIGCMSQHGVCFVCIVNCVSPVS